jgi:hypothetical protein
MLLTVYLLGWLVMSIGALVAADWVSGHRLPGPLACGSLVILAGALWPVLVVGAVEMVFIVIVAKRMRAVDAHEHDETIAARHPVLAR